METVVSVSNLIKRYPLYRRKLDKIREAFSVTGRRYHKDFEALKGISFEVGKGECVGIIGLNGSGKSTLLKILTGVVQPTSGSIRTEGRIAALLELGAGFNPEYTGLENIYLNTLLMGMSREETEKRLPEILAFADIGEFIYQPVKIYSSGMFVRLAFSIAVTVEPDILIIDEALSVGDVFFQQKCYQKIREMSEHATVLIVSHDLNSITKFCKRLLVLNNGVLIFDGEAGQAVTEYFKIRQGSVLSGKVREQIEDGFRRITADKLVRPEESQYSGRMDAVIESFYYQVDEVPFAEYCEAGRTVYVRMLVQSTRPMDSIIVGYQVRDTFGNETFGETSMTSGYAGTELREGRSMVSFQFVWPEVREGDYFITLGIGEVNNEMEHFRLERQ